MYNNYNEFKNTYIDTNECTSRGACSIAPNIASLQVIIIYFIKQLAYYVIKLEKLGANNVSIKYEIINDLASLVSINEFSEKQLYAILAKDYQLYTEAKKAYHEICTQKGIFAKDLKNQLEFNENTTVSKAIAQGEKLFLEKYNKLTSGQKNLISILQILLKSASMNLIKLNEFKDFDDNVYQKILTILDMFNHGKVSNKQIKDSISELAEIDNKLQFEISELLLKKFGGISKVNVSHSTKKGKAILVSGNNFADLLNILNETKDKNIDVYTHSNLLIVHALKEFQQYPNLRGHYGDTTESCILDFATFPGSILLTKNSRSNTEYLYRGRLFSNDYIIHQGVVKIENENYSELIESAEKAKGFTKGKIKDDTPLGYNEDELNNEINKLTERLKKNEIKKLYIIGMNPYSEIQKEYFKEFFSLLKPEEFALSFSFESKKDNVLTINIGNYNPLAINIIHQIFEKYEIDSNKIVFFFTTCDVMTISNIVMLKHVKAKNIYMATCPPMLVNPSVFDTFRNEYSINLTDTPHNDLEKIRKE